jgi:multidrug resistance efflux pump
MTDKADPVALEAAPPPRPAPPPASANGELRERVQKLRIGSGPAKGGGGRVAWLPWLLCAALALAWGGYAVRNYSQKGVATDTAPTAASSATADGGSGPELSVKGYLVPARQISVSPIDVGGKVLELRPAPARDGRPAMPFAEGVLYEKGDVIAVLQSDAYKAQVDEAVAGVAAAVKRLDAARQRLAAQDPKSVRAVEVEQVQAQLKEAQATRLRAEQELQRLQGLSAVATREVQQAQADVATGAARVRNLETTLIILKEGPRKETLAALEADVKGAEADVAVANARLVQAQWRLENCTIKAPITGTVLTKAAEVGKLVNPMAFSGGGAICDMADLADLEADLEIAEKDISKLKVGQPCTIRADAYSDKKYDGTLDRIMPIANRAKSIVSVRVKVKLPAGEVPGTFLKPEMGAVVDFLKPGTVDGPKADGGKKADAK